MSRRPATTTRQRELVELTRHPAPPGYDLAPQNRKQRRALCKALARNRKASKR